MRYFREEIVVIYWLCIFFIWGWGVDHIWQCSGFIPASVLRGLSWWRSGESYGILGIEPGLTVCKANTLLAVRSLWPSLCIF